MMEEKKPTRRTLYSSHLTPSTSRSFSGKKKKSVDLSKNTGLDREALDLLSVQHEHIKQIKGDIKRKEQVISELHEHVDDLLKYKEENIKMNTEIKRLREILENKEEENRRFNRQIENIEDEKLQNEEEAESMRRRVNREKEELKKKVQNLNSKLTDLVELTEESKHTNRQLENQVETLRHEISRARKLQEKTESDNGELVEELNQQVQLLQDREFEFKKQNDDLNEELNSMKISDRDKDRTIQVLHEQRGEWENKKRKQKSFIQALQKNIANVQKKVGSLRFEAEKVPTLEKELERIPILRNEYEKAKEEMHNISEILDSKILSNEQLEEENRLLVNKKEELELGFRRTKKALEETRTTNKDSEARYRREIDTLQMKLQSLQDEYDHYYNGSEKEKKARGNDIQQMNKFFNTLKKKVDRTLSGEGRSGSEGEEEEDDEDDDVGLSLTTTPTLNSIELEGFTRVLQQFQTKLKDSLREVDVLRRNNNDLKEESEEQERRIREKIKESSKLLKQQQTVISKFEREKKEVLEEAERIHQKNQGLEEDLHQRTRVVFNTCQQLKDLIGGYDDLVSEDGDDGIADIDIDDDDDDDDMDMDDENRKRKIRRKRRSRRLIGDWDSMQRKFEDTVSKVVVGVNDLRKKLNVVKDQQQEQRKEMEMEMEKNRQQYKDGTDRLQRENLSKMRELELTFRKEKNELIGDLEEKEKKYRNRIKEFHEDLEESNLKNQKLDHLKEMLKKSVEEGKRKISQLVKIVTVLGRAVRPYVQTTNALRTKLQILSLQVSVTEDLASQLVQFFRGLHTEFSSSSFLWKSSKSPTSTSVFSGHRLIRSLEQSAHQLRHIQRRISREEYEHHFMKDTTTTSSSTTELSSSNILDVADTDSSDPTMTNESMFLNTLNLLNEDEVSRIDVRGDDDDDADAEETGLDQVLGVISTKRLDPMEAFVRVMRLLDPKLFSKSETPFNAVTQQIQAEKRRYQKKGRRRRKRRDNDDDDYEDDDDEEEEYDDDDDDDDNNKKRSRRQVRTGDEDPVVKQCKRTCNDILSQFQKLGSEKAQSSQKAQELAQEVQSVGRRNDLMEREDKKKQELIKVMDEQIKRLEETSSEKVSPSKLRNLQEAVQQLRSENRALSEEAEMARNAERRLKKTLKDKARKLQGTRKSLDDTQKSFSEVLRKARDMDGEIKGLKQDRNKYKFMVEELNDKYVMNDRSKYIDDDEQQEVEQQKRKIIPKRDTRRTQFDDDDDDDDNDDNKGIEDEIDRGRNDVRRQKKARSAIKKTVTFSPIIHTRKPRQRTTKTFDDDDDDDDDINDMNDDDDDDYQSRRRRKKRRRPLRTTGGDDDGTTLTPVLEELNQSQELVRQLSKANTNARREMEDLDREIQKAKTSMRELQESTELASPKKSRFMKRRSFY